MNKFIPRDKLSKKARQELDSQQRMTWNGLCPVTKKIESKKVYNRKKAYTEFDDSCNKPFLFYKKIIYTKIRNTPNTTSCFATVP